MNTAWKTIAIVPLLFVYTASVAPFALADGLQTAHTVFVTDDENDRLQRAVVTDVTGDEIPEIVVGVTRPSISGIPGTVLIYDGDLSLIDQIDHPAVPQFGASVAPMSDYNGDGVRELFVSRLSGSSIVDPVTHEFLLDVPAPDFVLFNTFGLEAWNVGDVDADGLDDVAVASGSGRASVHAGADLSVLHEFVPSDFGLSEFGVRRFTGLGDRDGDGHADFAISVPFETNPDGSVGRVALLSGQTGEVIWETFGETSEPLVDFGKHLEEIPDIDGDGLTDVCVAAPTYGAQIDFFGPFPGRLYFLSGADGSTITTTTGCPEEVHVIGWNLCVAENLYGRGEPYIVFSRWLFGQNVVVFSLERMRIEGEMPQPQPEGDFFFLADRTADFDLDGHDQVVFVEEQDGAAGIDHLSIVEVIPEPWRRGDTNDDGELDVADAVSILDWLFADGTEPPCPPAADTNNDLKVDLADAILALSATFAGVPLDEPFGSCGLGYRYTECVVTSCP